MDADVKTETETLAVPRELCVAERATKVSAWFVAAVVCAAPCVVRVVKMLGSAPACVEMIRYGEVVVLVLLLGAANMSAATMLAVVRKSMVRFP